MKNLPVEYLYLLDKTFDWTRRECRFIFLKKSLITLLKLGPKICLGLRRQQLTKHLSFWNEQLTEFFKSHLLNIPERSEVTFSLKESLN